MHNIKNPNKVIYNNWAIISILDIPNLYLWETCMSKKHADAMNKALIAEESRAEPLNVLIQVNTSEEDS
eukprot:Pgem_evm1s15769